MLRVASTLQPLVGNTRRGIFRSRTPQAPLSLLSDQPSRCAPSQDTIFVSRSAPQHASVDFTSTLIPLYPPFPLPVNRVVTQQNGSLRCFSSDSKPPTSTNDDKKQGPSTESPSSGGPEPPPPSSPLKSLQDTTGPVGLHEFYDSARKRVYEVEWNTGDLLSVYGIVALIVVVAVAPFMIRHMRRSDSTYEDIDSEDPVADLAKIVRAEYITKVGGEAVGGSSTLGGLDTLVADLLKSPQIQEAVTDLVNKILQSPKIKLTCQILLKELFQDLVNDPETLKQIVHLLQHAIQDEQIKEAAIQLVTDVFGDKEVLAEITVLFERLGQEKQVQMATQTLLVESAHNALNDPEILDHSMEFATDVVGDDVVQQTAGEALYNTLSYAVRPTLSVVLSIVGVGLLVVSLVAFRNANSPDATSMDRAIMDTLEKTGSLSKLFTYPLDFLIGCKDALMCLLMLPFNLVSGTFHSMGKAGNLTVNTIQQFLGWLLRLPSHVFQSMVQACGTSFQHVSGAIGDGYHQLLSTISSSFLGKLLQRALRSMSHVTGSFQTSWDATNRFLANGAIMIENLLYKLTQPVTTLVGRISLQDLSLRLSLVWKSIELHWFSIDCFVVRGATALQNKWDRFVVEVLNGVSAAGDSWKSIRERVSAWIVTVDDIVRDGRSRTFHVYGKANRLADALGLFLEDFVAQIIARARGGSTKQG